MARLIDNEIERFFFNIMGVILVVGPNGVVKLPHLHSLQKVYWNYRILIYHEKYYFLIFSKNL